MIESILFGGGFAFAAAVQPGPLQAFLLSRVAIAGWRRTLPAALAPIISDVPIALVMLLLLHTLAQGFESVLRGIGGVVLLYFAFRALLEWRRAAADGESEGPSAPRTLVDAVVVNLFNPGPYIGWSLILGPLVLEKWPTHPHHVVALILSFYAVMTLSLAVSILLMGTTAFLGPRGRRALVAASAAALAVLGVWSILSAFR